MNLLDGTTYPEGIIGGKFAPRDNGGNYRDLAHAIVSKLRKQFDMPVSLPSSLSPYAIFSLWPSEVSEWFVFGSAGLAAAVTNIPGELRYGQGHRIRVGDAGPDWLYVPPRLIFSYRASDEFSKDMLVLHAPLVWS